MDPVPTPPVGGLTSPLDKVDWVRDWIRTPFFSSSHWVSSKVYESDFRGLTERDFVPFSRPVSLVSFVNVLSTSRTSTQSASVFQTLLPFVSS